MFGNDDLHLLYAESLRHHSFGYALYHPCPSTVLTPGSIGYFDDVGEWHPMEFESFNQLVKGMKMGEVEHANWGPITTKEVSQVNLSGSASITYSGIPATAKAVYKYKSTTNFGAVLLTDQISKYRYYADGPFSTWIHQNSNLIESQYPEIKSYGLWVVTEILCTPKAALNVWTTKERETVVGFTAGVKGVVDVQENGTWHTDTEDSGWTYFNEQGKEFVVFISGLHYVHDKTPDFLRRFTMRNGDGEGGDKIECKLELEQKW